MRIRARGFNPLLSTSVAARVCVVGLGVVASGCAASKQPTYVGGPYAGAHQVVPAPVPSRVNELRKVEIEDDGKPAQAPPVRKMRPEEDDPSQPWSRNYGKGGSAPAVSGDAVMPAPTRAPWPKPVDASMRTTAVAPQVFATRRLSEAEAEDVMVRAVAAHEMRKQ